MGIAEHILISVLETTLVFVYGIYVLLYLLWVWSLKSYSSDRDEQERELPPLCLRNPLLGHHRFMKLKKVKIHYVESGNPENPLVVLVHGIPDFWFAWRRQIPVLSNSFWVIAVDLPGCGDSDRLRSSYHYNLREVVENLVLLIHGLGRETTHLVCSGTGGNIGWQMASLHPEMVSKLVLIHAPHPYVIRQMFHSSWKHYYKYWYLLLLRLPGLPENYAQCKNSQIIDDILRPLMQSKYVDEGEIEAYKYNYSRKEDWSGSINHLRQIDLSRISAEEEAPSIIENKTLLIMGDSDPLLPMEAAYRSAEFAERINIRCIAGGTRWIQVTDAAKVNELIIKFLENPQKQEVTPSPKNNSLVGRFMGAGLAAMSTTMDRYWFQSEDVKLPHA